MRLALGSSRLGILRQLSTEALVISLGGGAVGILGGALLLRRLVEWNPFPQFPTTWIPAQRALSIDPAIVSREE